MDVGSHTVAFHEAAQDAWIGGGYLLALKPPQACVVLAMGDGQREAAFAEAKRAHHLGILLALLKLVLPHYTQVGYACSHTLRYVVVAQKQHFDGEVATLHQQGATALRHLDACLRQQCHGVLIEPSL